MIKKQEQYNEILWRVYDKKYPVDKNGNRPKTVGSLTFQVTEACTLTCKYCYQHNKSPKVMTLDVAKKFIDRIFIDCKDKYFGMILEFIGGEPFLQPKLIGDIIDYWYYKCIKEDMIEWGVLCRFSICSNGTEWKNPKVQKLMKKIGNNTSFTVSIDGNKELHDSARIHPDGSGSYDEAIYAATDYEKRWKTDIGSKMTIAPSNIIFVYPALKHYLDIGKTEIYANCVYEEGWTYDHAKLLYQEMKKLADYKLKNYPEEYISFFEEDNFCPMDESDNKNWCGGTGDMLACGPDGIIYPCLRYMPSSVGERDEYVTCGDVENGIDFIKIAEMQKVTRRSQSTDECFYCPIARGCSWCSAYNWESQGSYDKRATYICPMHKARALVNVYYWNKYYRQIGSKKRMKNYCPKDWALQIISKEEYEMLNRLAEE